MTRLEPAPVESEVARLRRAYDSYRSEGVREARWSQKNPGNRLMAAEWRAALQRILASSGRVPLSGLDILDLGCGDGDLLADLRKCGARADRLHGIDLMRVRVDEARRRYPDFDLCQMNAEHLGFRASAFDLVFMFTIVTSILDEDMALNVAREATRVLRPGGAIVWYDFRYDNPLNRHVRGISARRIRTLFPSFRLELETITVVPPLTRKLGRGTESIYRFLQRFPVLRTHYIGLLHKPHGDIQRLEPASHG